MNTNDYKAISEMNKRWLKPFVHANVYEVYCTKQADYFDTAERIKYGVHRENYKFNRKQFLKDCGVEE